VNGSTNSPGFQGPIDSQFQRGAGWRDQHQRRHSHLAVQADIASSPAAISLTLTGHHNHLIRLDSAGVSTQFQSEHRWGHAEFVRASQFSRMDGFLSRLVYQRGRQQHDLQFELHRALEHRRHGGHEFQRGAGANNTVLALAVDSQQRILVGGEFTRFSGVTRSGIRGLIRWHH